MKLIYRLFFLCFCLFPLSQLLTAQSFLPMLEEGKSFYVSHQCLGLTFCGGRYGTDYQYLVQGDTILNNLNYKKIYYRSQELGGAMTWSGLQLGFFMREDTLSGKVWMLNDSNRVNCPMQCAAGAEQLLFDFSLTTGDTLSNCSDASIVVTKDSTITTADGKNRKFLRVAHDLDWGRESVMIEGLGGDYINWELCVLAWVDYIDLYCVSLNNVNLYGPCGNILNQDQAVIQEQRVLYVNAQQMLRVRAAPRQGELILRDVQGRMIWRRRISPAGGTFSLSGLPDGIFIWQYRSGTDLESGKLLLSGWK